MKLFSVNSTDAREWAEEFCRIRKQTLQEFGFIPEETPDSMECWFASALLAGKREGIEGANAHWQQANKTTQ